MAFPGHPLFDTPDRLADQSDPGHYPTLYRFLHRCPGGAESDFRAACEFLAEHTGTSGTYTRFRGEIQRFLLYLWVVASRSLSYSRSPASELTSVIEHYYQFLRTPPGAWVASRSSRGFVLAPDGSARIADPSWRPFLHRQPDTPYRSRQSTVDASTRALSAFFRYLDARGYVRPNPFIQVRRSRQRAVAVKDRNARGTIRRLTGFQWASLLEALHRAAEAPRYERHLFVVVTLKSLYLRVGELAPRKDDTGQWREPVFGDFGRHMLDCERSWDLYVFGKGDKHRWVTVPDAYLPYLRRWREHLGLTPLPDDGEQFPILPKSTGVALGQRQVIRTVEQAFLVGADYLREQGYETDANEMARLNASTHYLRHTGASMDIEAGRPIRHVSEDLGHSSVAFTEAQYVNADQSQKYRTGRKRRI